MIIINECIKDKICLYKFSFYAQKPTVYTLKVHKKEKKKIKNNNKK